jgi:hypothetical protein
MSVSRPLRGRLTLMGFNCADDAIAMRQMA